MGREPWRLDHGFSGGNIQRQVLFMHASEGAQVGLECGSRFFAGVAVDLADSLVIIIIGPLPSAVTHRGMGRMAAMITLPCIRVQDRALLGKSIIRL
jgi:hypothetical protein